MHILLTPSWYPKTPHDIVGCFFREQALALSRHGYKVGVIYPQIKSFYECKKNLSLHQDVNVEIDKGLTTIRSHSLAWFPCLPYANTKLWIRHGMKLFKAYIAANGKPDIIHAHSLLNGGLLAFAIQRRYNIDYVVTEHSTTFERGLIKPWQKNLALKAASMAGAQLAVSEPFADFLEGFFSGCIRWDYLPNVLPTNFEINWKKKPISTSNIFTFCNVSLLTPKKGLDILLHAFAKTFTNNKNIRLKIGGDGPQREELERIAAKLHISEHVDFLGSLNRDQVMDLMASSQAYVLSSHIETFGVVVIESLASGKPVIATRCGGPESIVRPEDGYLIANNDVDAMAKAMQQLYEKYDSFDPLEIRRSCLNRFGEQTVIGHLTDIYKKIVKIKFKTEKKPAVTK